MPSDNENKSGNCQVVQITYTCFFHFFMQYRTGKTYFCKFLVLAGYLRSFYQFFLVNFGFGSLSFPFNCHLKQYSNLVFSSGLHTCYIYIYIIKFFESLDTSCKRAIPELPDGFLEGFWGVVVQRCAQNV